MFKNFGGLRIRWNWCSLEMFHYIEVELGQKSTAYKESI